MFGRFGKDAGSLLGIEIVATAVRLVQLGVVGAVAQCAPGRLSHWLLGR